MNRASEVLFEQTRQLQFLESKQGQQYLIAFEESMAALHGRDNMNGPEGYVWYLTRELIRQADPIYVSHDVCEIVDEARKSFEPEQVLPTDLFTACGWAVLPRALPLTDRRDVDQYVRAIGWMPMRESDDEGMENGGAWVMLFSHADDDKFTGDERVNLDWRALSPHAVFQLSHIFFIPYYTNGWDNIVEVLTETDREKDMEAAWGQWVLVQTFWRLGSQLVPAKEKAARAPRRDAQRKGLHKEDITVVKLRREREPNYDDRNEGEGGWLTNRHIVRGHWRNQWYPSLQQHRQIWINPYVKGPEDGDLIVTDRVYEFVR